MWYDEIFTYSIEHKKILFYLDIFHTKKLPLGQCDTDFELLKKLQISVLAPNKPFVVLVYNAKV